MAQRGVLEEGVLTIPDDGTPQGGVISPLLANIFLHYVLDEWFEKEVRPRLKGEAFLIRYADDFVIGAAREDDARRIMEVLPKRMSKYGLTVHPEKTRLVRFQPPQSRRLRHRRSGTHPNRGHSTFWDSPITGADPSEAHGWSNGRRRRADSSVRFKRCRNGVGRICTFRSRSNTRSSRKSCGATTGTTGLLATSPASRNSGRQREGSGDASCLGDAETVRVTWARVPSSGEAIQSSPRPSGPRPAEQRSEVMR